MKLSKCDFVHKLLSPYWRVSGYRFYRMVLLATH